MPSFAANLATGLAQGATSAKETVDRRSEVQRQDAENRVATASAEASLAVGLPQQEVEALKAQNQAMLGKLAKQDTYSALQAYDADSNVKHLNQMMQENPELRKIYSDIASVDKIDPNQDTQLLLKKGLDPGMFTDENLDQDAVQHRYLKITRPDGSKEIVDLQDLQGATGYFNHLTKQRLDIALKRSQIKKAEEGPGQGVPSTLEKKARFLSEQSGRPLKDVAAELGLAEIAGVTPGKLNVATQAEAGLNETFEQKYFETDFTLRKNKVRATQFIRQIEKAGGANFTSQDRADLKDINTLLVSGTTAIEELTPEATGILDNFTSNIQKFLSDSAVPETLGRSAYNAYRNALLRSFGGTAMSESEVKNFEKAFGSLAQKHPAVLTQFQQAMEQTQAKLNTIAQLNNPYIAHYYLGTSQDELDIAMAKLDDKIQLMTRAGRKADKSVEGKQADWRADWVNK